MKTKLISVLLACVVATSLIACGKSEDAEVSNEAVETVEAVAELVTESTVEVTDEATEDATEAAVVTGMTDNSGIITLPEVKEFYPSDSADVEYTQELSNNGILSGVLIPGDRSIKVDISMVERVSNRNAQKCAEDNQAVLTDYDYQPATIAGKDVYASVVSLNSDWDCESVYYEEGDYVYYMDVMYYIGNPNAKEYAEELAGAVIDAKSINVDAANSCFPE